MSRAVGRIARPRSPTGRHASEAAQLEKGQAARDFARAARLGFGAHEEPTTYLDQLTAIRPLYFQCYPDRPARRTDGEKFHP